MSKIEAQKQEKYKKKKKKKREKVGYGSRTDPNAVAVSQRSSCLLDVF